MPHSTHRNCDCIPEKILIDFELSNIEGYLPRQTEHVHDVVDSENQSDPESETSLHLFNHLGINAKLLRESCVKKYKTYERKVSISKNDIPNSFESGVIFADSQTNEYRKSK